MNFLEAMRLCYIGRMVRRQAWAESNLYIFKNVETNTFFEKWPTHNRLFEFVLQDVESTDWEEYKMENK